MPNTRSTRSVRTTATVQAVVKAEGDTVVEDPGRGRRPKKRVKVEREEVVYAEAVGTCRHDVGATD